MSFAATSVLAFSALAETPLDSKITQSEYTNESISQERHTDRPKGASKARDLIGMAVKNYQGDSLGKVAEIGVDVESGRIVQVILGHGGWMSFGQSYLALPPTALQHDVAQKILYLNIDKVKVDGAPKFDFTKWAEGSDFKHLSNVYAYYDQESALNFIQRGDGEKEQRSSVNQAMIPASRLRQTQQVSKLIGASVQNLESEKLGKVENMVLDLPSGRVIAVIISTGGFLRMGDELSAVPSTALRLTRDQETLRLDATKEMLSNAPHFQAQQWPDFAQSNYTSGVYHAYGIEPYYTTFTFDTIPQPDNTARNERDRNNQSLTPLDQGNSKADLEITSQIRKEIITDKSMSINAKNVKIITLDGRVTLRGPVKTTEERRLIGEIAERIVNAENVENQLEVKFITTSSNY